MFNWTDLALIALVVIGIFAGYKKGFVHSSYKIASFFASIGLALMFYPQMTDFLTNQLGIGGKIQGWVTHNMQAKFSLSSLSVPDMMGGLSLPSTVQNVIQNNLQGSLLSAAGNAVNAITSKLAGMAINIVSILALYIVLRVLFSLVKFLLEGMVKLPVFKQVDEVGGAAFGGAEAVLTVYLVFALLTFFSSTGQIPGILDTVKHSALASYMYDNNLILIWAFGR